jgi:diacylglycerol kinase family enzyme
LNHLHPLEAKIEVDNLKFENLFFYTFAIQNGKYYGGGFKICPEASLCDGFLDICYATPPLSKIKAAWVFLKAKNGLHTKEKPIHFLSGTTIHLKFKNPIPVQVDGEALPASEYKVELLPKALRVLSL